MSTFPCLRDTISTSELRNFLVLGIAARGENPVVLDFFRPHLKGKLQQQPQNQSFCFAQPQSSESVDKAIGQQLSFVLLNRRLFWKYIGLDSKSIKAAGRYRIASPRVLITSDVDQILFSDELGTTRCSLLIISNRVLLYSKRSGL